MYGVWLFLLHSTVNIFLYIEIVWLYDEGDFTYIVGEILNVELYCFYQHINPDTATQTIRSDSFKQSDQKLIDDRMIDTSFEKEDC